MATPFEFVGVVVGKGEASIVQRADGSTYNVAATTKVLVQENGDADFIEFRTADLLAAVPGLRIQLGNRYWFRGVSRALSNAKGAFEIRDLSAVVAWNEAAERAREALLKALGFASSESTAAS